MKRHFLRGSKTLQMLTLLFLLLGAGGFEAWAAPVISNVQPSVPATLNRFAAHEMTFTLSGYTANKEFDPDVVRVEAIFSCGGCSPAVSEKAYGFQKTKTPTEVWAVRYAPRIAGSYSFTLIAYDNNVPSNQINGTFTVTSTSSGAGFVGLDTANARRFKTSNGNAFVINGVNGAWSGCKVVGGQLTCAEGGASTDWDLDYQTLFSNMQNYKMNTTRLFVNQRWDAYGLEWAANNTGPWRGLNYTGGNAYDTKKFHLSNAARLDTVIQNAQQSNLYIVWSLRDHLEFEAGNGWDKSVYNGANYALNDPDRIPCVTADPCFMTDPLARKRFKAYLFYQFARYGAYSALGFLEVANEIDNGGFRNIPLTTLAQWQQEMAQYWKSLDFYSRPVTTSYAWKDHLEFGIYQDTWPDLGEFTTRNSHTYDSAQKAVEKWLDQIDWLQDGVENTDWAGDGIKAPANPSMVTRPAYYGEVGPEMGEPSSEYPNLANLYQDSAWVPFFFVEAAGTSLIWKVDGTYCFTPGWEFVPHNPASRPYRAFGAFIQNELGNLPTMPFLAATGANVKTAGYKRPNRALLLMRDTTAYWNIPNPPDQTGQTYNLTGMTPGAYRVEYWRMDTDAGAYSTSTVTVPAGGNVTLTVPTFKRAVAIKVYPNPSYTIPPAPTAPLAAAASPTQVNLSWTNASTNATSIEIQRCAGSGCTVFAAVATVAGNTAAYQDTVNSNTLYRYRIRANNPAGNSGFSAIVQATTPVGYANLTGIQKLNGLTAASVTLEPGSSNNPGNPVGNLFNEQNTIGDPPASAPTSPYIPAAPPQTCNGTSCPTVFYVNLGASYAVKRLYWWDGAGFDATANVWVGSPGNWQYLTCITFDRLNQWAYKELPNNQTNYLRFEFSWLPTTNLPSIGEMAVYIAAAGGQPPAAPTGLTATAISSSQINLSWTDNANNESGYLIERCAGAGCTGFVQVGTTGANVAAYSDTGLTASTTYRYQVRAYNGSGNSAYSNIAQATTLPPATCNGETFLSLSAGQVTYLQPYTLQEVAGFEIGKLVDAQTNITAPPVVGSNTPNPNGAFIPSWQTSATTPTNVIIDLNGSRCVKSVYFYDAEDIGTVEIFYDAGGTWVSAGTFTTELYQVWRKITVFPAQTQTAKLRLKFTTSPRIGEIAVFIGN